MFNGSARAVLSQSFRAQNLVMLNVKKYKGIPRLLIGKTERIFPSIVFQLSLSDPSPNCPSFYLNWHAQHRLGMTLSSRNITCVR